MKWKGRVEKVKSKNEEKGTKRQDEMAVENWRKISCKNRLKRKIKKGQASEREEERGLTDKGGEEKRGKNYKEGGGGFWGTQRRKGREEGI